jgi:hypothetical protein
MCLEIWLSRKTNKENLMKIVLAVLFVIGSFSTAALASDHTYPGGCKGQLLGSCTEVDGNGNQVGPNFVTCIARDSSNIKYTYTGSYGKPTHENVLGAVNQCKANSDDPASCHWTACRWAD